MKILGVIPSRYNSTRLPGKPLKMIGDLSMVMRVYNQCKKATEISNLVVATDDERIFEHINSNGGLAIMTAKTHNTGTERCAEVLGQMKEKYDYVINIQGDEPFIKPAQIQELISILDGQTEIGTLCRKIYSEDELFDPGIPKVVLGENNLAMYFSRAPIPYVRNEDKSNWIKTNEHYKHIGIYGYRSDILATIIHMQPSMVEEMEQLEQLRWLANGLKIRAVLSRFDSISVDTQEDLEKARSYLNNN